MVYMGDTIGAETGFNAIRMLFKNGREKRFFNKLVGVNHTFFFF